MRLPSEEIYPQLERAYLLYQQTDAYFWNTTGLQNLLVHLRACLVQLLLLAVTKKVRPAQPLT